MCHYGASAGKRRLRARKQRREFVEQVNVFIAAEFRSYRKSAFSQNDFVHQSLDVMFLRLAVDRQKKILRTVARSKQERKNTLLHFSPPKRFEYFRSRKFFR